MPKKTVDIRLGSPLVGEADPAHRLASAATPQGVLLSDRPDEASGNSAHAQIVQCPYCSAIAYVRALDGMTGWTACNHCGASYQL